MVRPYPVRARRRRFRESGPQRARRGRDLARLDLALRYLGATIGQRPGWRAQHQDGRVHAHIDWRGGADALLAQSPRLGAWAYAAAERTRGALAAVGAAELPVTVVHGDFAEWNVHYSRGRLAGIMSFGLTHLDSRPYELAIARTYRAPEAAGAYRAELAVRGWPLSELEETAIEPVYQAFRVDMAAWEIEQGRRTGRFDLAVIERQLAGPAPRRPEMIGTMKYADVEAPSALGHVPEHLGVERAPGSCSKLAWPTVWTLAAQDAFPPEVIARAGSENEGDEPAAAARLLERAGRRAGSAARNGEFPVVLGGDCSLLLGVDAGAAAARAVRRLSSTATRTFTSPRSTRWAAQHRRATWPSLPGAARTSCATGDGARSCATTTWSCSPAVSAADRERSGCQPLPPGMRILDRDTSGG